MPKKCISNKQRTARTSANFNVCWHLLVQRHPLTSRNAAQRIAKATALLSKLLPTGSTSIAYSSMNLSSVVYSLPKGPSCCSSSFQGASHGHALSRGFKLRACNAVGVEVSLRYSVAATQATC
jgi:hypothetical protein